MNGDRRLGQYLAFPQEVRHFRNLAVKISSNMVYSQLSLRRTPLGPALAVRLIESQIEGAKKGRDQLWVSVLQRCPLRES